MCPPTKRKELEGELQAELHDPSASRTKQRIAISYVRGGATAPERAGCGGVIPQSRSRRRTVGIGDERMIEQVEYLEPELGSPALSKLEVLEYGEIPVLEARIAEQVPGHIAEVVLGGRRHDRVTCHVAATRLKRTPARRIRGLGYALVPHGGGLRGGELAHETGDATRHRTTGAAGNADNASAVG